MYDFLFDSTAAEVPAHPRRQPEYGGAVTPDNLKSIFRRCADFESRTLRVGQCELFLCWLDGLVDSLETAETLLRPLLLLGGICAGLYGAALLSCLLAVELSSLESFGRSYTAPLSGEERFGMAALLVSPPLFARKLWDRALNTPDRRRQR